MKKIDFRKVDIALDVFFAYVLITLEGHRFPTLVTFPTDPFQTSELQNTSQEVSEQNEVDRSSDLEALKL